MNREERAHLEGVLAIDKPIGWTSHDVVAVARGVLGERRLGHGGTLDPLATGVLPLLVGPATKFVERLHTATKVYAAIVRFGSETTTDDREGEATRSAAPPGRSQLEGALQGLRGPIQQIPPAYAALKVDGRRAYSRARAGETVVLAAREVHVHRLDVARWSSDDEVVLLVVCSSGTYVRAIARDLGRASGSAAHLAGLRRLAVGALDVRDAIGIDALRAAGREAATARLRPADDRLLTLDPVYLDGPAAALAPETP
ncbi:MAG TPA: tRNA pseudouridine(55) synthase TruB [Candidatus Limnocylindria bacterium]|nr:tRNA pseudouridine(55) synthase TruB [Candidatus Limnocylindria bacterium]